MYIFILTYRKPLDVVDAYLDEHRKFLDKHYAEGKFIMSGPREQRIGGVIVCSASRKEEAERIMKEDPFYINNIADYELIYFEASKHAAALANMVC